MNYLIQVDDDAVEALVKHCPRLHTLILPGCVELTDESIEHISKHALELKVLDMSGVKGISDSR